MLFFMTGSPPATAAFPLTFSSQFLSYFNFLLVCYHAFPVSIKHGQSHKSPDALHFPSLSLDPWDGCFVDWRGGQRNGIHVEALRCKCCTTSCGSMYANRLEYVGRSFIRNRHLILHRFQLVLGCSAMQLPLQLQLLR